MQRRESLPANLCNNNIAMNSASTALTPSIFGNNNLCNRKWREISLPHSSPPPGNGVRLFVTKATSPSSSAPETDKKKKGQLKRKNKNKEKDDEKQDEDKIQASIQQPQQTDLSSSTSSVSAIKSTLDDVNPVGLGRRSRQIFDEVWRKFSGLGQISRTTRTEDDESGLLMREGGPMCEFAIPGAQNTTVLVVGATSRVGRIVVRKLMLRGYTVKVFFFLPQINVVRNLKN